MSTTTSMSASSIEADSYLWCVGNSENPLPAFPKDWASLYPKYHTWLQEAIRMQVENGVMKERTDRNGNKIYNMTALVKIIGQYDTLKSALSILDDMFNKHKHDGVNIIEKIEEISSKYHRQTFVPPLEFLDLVIGLLRPNQEGFLPSLYRKHIEENGRLVAVGSSLATDLTMQNHEAIETNPALQIARTEMEIAIQPDLPQEMQGRMTLTNAQITASGNVAVIKDKAQLQHERKLQVMEKAHELRIRTIREEGELKIRIRELELKNNLDTLRLRLESKNNGEPSNMPVRKSVRQARLVLVQPDWDVKKPQDLEQAIAIILDNYFHASTKTKDCIPVDNIKEVVRCVMNNNLLDFAWSQEEKNTRVAQLDSMEWDFVVNFFLAAKQQYKKALVTRSDNATVFCHMGCLNILTTSKVVIGVHFDYARAEKLSALMPVNQQYGRPMAIP